MVLTSPAQHKQHSTNNKSTHVACMLLLGQACWFGHAQDTCDAHVQEPAPKKKAEKKAPAKKKAEKEEKEEEEEQKEEEVRDECSCSASAQAACCSRALL
eukprot:scaffold76427_cov17-Tisochrysis_lutea.AAC.1